jgi:regulator of sirC expression with transglutaminase-like and TPR domain
VSGVPLADRLAALFDRPSEPTLDHVAAVIAQLDPDAPPEEEILARLDRLAAEVPPGDDRLNALSTHLFGTLGLAGAAATYYEPANSYLHEVLERRRGIPITLSIVMIETGRRCGLELTGVGMPGHFLVGDGRAPDRWFDPFAAGRPLTRDACRQLFTRLHPGAEFDDAWLQPIGPLEIAARMLQNLRIIHLRTGHLPNLAAVVEMRAALPISTLADQLELATILARLGRHEAAATQRDRLARLDPAQAAEHLRAAHLHRAHRN